MESSLRDQFSDFVNMATSDLPPFIPFMEVLGEGVSCQPTVHLDCDIEGNGSGDWSYCLKLLICSPEDESDHVEIEMTTQADLASLQRFFHEDTMPVQLLLCRPSSKSLAVVMAQIVAKKADYKVTLDDDGDNIRLVLKIARGCLLTATVERHQVARYFGLKDF